MVSEASLDKDGDVAGERRVGRLSSHKKNHGKVPRKIHKAEREKLKRDHLNVLFLELDKALEPTQQNNGKACILTDATRLLRDLLAQVDCLKRDNAALLSESHYVTMEKNELREDNSALEAQIKKLQSELEEKIQSKPAWNLDHPQLQDNGTTPYLQENRLMLPVTDHTSQTSPIVGPVFVVPLHQDLQTYHQHNTTASNVSRPHARYPLPSDSWPSQILASPQRTPQQLELQTGTSGEGD